MTQLSFRILALVAVLGVARVGRAQVELLLERPDTAGVLVPATSTPTVQGPVSLAWQPANLALGPSGLSYVHEDGASGIARARRSDGVFVNLGGLSLGEAGAAALGFGAEWIRPRSDCSAATPCSRRLSLGLSAGTPELALGGSWHWLASDDSAAVDGLGALDLGISWRPARWLSVSLAGRSLNAPRTVPRQGSLGFGVRPFGETLTLAAEYQADDRGGLGRGRFGYLADLRLGGLDLVGQLAHSIRPASGSVEVVATLSLRASFGHAALTLGGGGFFSGPSGAAGAFEVDLTGARGRYLFGEPPVAKVLDLSEALAGPSQLSMILGAPRGLDAFTKLSLRLERLANDDALDTLVVEIKGVRDLSLGRIEELRSLILGLRAKGRHVIAWLPGGGDAEYYVATAAERIYAAPQSLFEINGLSSQRIYLRGLLDKLGIEPEFVKIGEYKSAPEQFTNTQPSEPAAEETNALLDDSFARYVQAIATARGLDEAKVKALLDRGLMLGETAAKDGLIDGVTMNGPGLEEAVTKLAGRALPLSKLEDEPWVAERWSDVPVLAVIEVKGDILPGSMPGTAGAERIVKQLRRAAADDEVRAIVLRVESPGGDVGASEQLWQAVREVAKRKPVVASFGDVAASGGYYVGCAADAIVAEPSTITGSIGVFAGKADLSKLLTTLGIDHRNFNRGEKADLLTLVRPWTEGEKAAFEAVVAQFYETFLQRVAEGRKMSPSDVDKVARGRVWTGSQAKERGLVDTLGGLDDALKLAATKAGLPEGRPVRVAGVSGWLEWAPGRSPETRAAGLDRLDPLEALGWLASRRSLAPLLAEALADRAWPLVEALATGRPLALAVDLPDPR